MRLLATAGLVGIVLLAAPTIAPASTTAHADPMITPRSAAADSWTEVKLPFLWPTKQLKDLAIAAPDSVWVTGGQGEWCIPNPIPTYPCLAYGPGNAVVRQWNGSKWLEYPLNGVAEGTGAMDEVKASGSEVWLADYGGYLGRFDGSAFHPVATPENSTAYALSVNPAGVWIMGASRTRYRWTGSGWTATPPPAGFSSIAGRVMANRPGEAWAGSERDGTPYLLRWDGSQWHAEVAIPSVGDYDTVVDLKVTASGEAWAIVDTPPGRPDPSHVFRYKNGSWTDVSPAGGGDYHDLTVDGQDSVWLGWNLKYDGTTWQQRTTPSGVYFSGMAGVPGTDDLWAFTRSPAAVYTTRN